MKEEKWAVLKEQLDKKDQYINSLRQDGRYPGRFRLPLHIEFDLTAGCNMRCLHCYNRSGDADLKTALEAADWLKLCRELVDNGGVFLCNLSGGEPLLLGDDLIKIMDVLHQDGTIFILNTNGYLVDEGWVKKLSKYNYSHVQVSIDGIGEAHDRLRQKKGSFQRAVRAAELFAEAGMPLSITSMVTPENLDSMDKMVDLASRVGAHYIGFSPVMYSGRSIKHPGLFLNNEQLNRIQAKADRLNARNTV
ncbi:MAG: radical SAM protein, partial [Desulfocucumaceae bacterium]